MIHIGKYLLNLMKITAEAFSNVDNVFQYDAMLKWIENEEK